MIIKFTINNVEYAHDTSNYPVDLSLNDFIREHANLYGTKFMCREGGCGSCTAVLTGVDLATGGPSTMPIFTCLHLVNTCNGMNITTIEGIGNRSIGYSEIQKRLASTNGSQCGYCSAGMVMNIHGTLLQYPNITAEGIEDLFGGNLCRCTGYRPILDAAKSFSSDSEYDFLDVCQDIEDLNLKEKVCPKTNIRCENKCIKANLGVISENRQWFSALDLSSIFTIFDSFSQETVYTLIHGATANGVYRRPDNITAFVDITKVTSLYAYSISAAQVTIGGNVTLTNVMDIFSQASKTTGFEYLAKLRNHFNKIANPQVRNVGSMSGNLMIKYAHNDFPSDVFIVLEAIGALISIVGSNQNVETYTPLQFLGIDMTYKVITKFTLQPLPTNQYIFDSYKIMPRYQNAHAYVNAAFLVKVDDVQTGIITNAQICFGGLADNFTHATNTEEFLVGMNFYNLRPSVLQSLNAEINPTWTLPETSSEFREQLAIDLFYKFYLAYSKNIQSRFKSGATTLTRNISSGTQSFDTVPTSYPVTQPIIKLEALSQCAGEADYTNDYPHSNSDLWAAFVHATRANSSIVSIDPSEALTLPGVITFFSSKDIPGKNTFTPTGYFFLYTTEEPILADTEIIYYGQAVGIIVAVSSQLAQKAARLVKIIYASKSSNNIKTNEMCTPQKSKVSKDHVENGFDHVNAATGEFDLGLQYHFFMEPQTTVCVPKPYGFDVHSATQFIDYTQVAVALCLNLPTNGIQVIVPRVGGGYGGKISRSIQIACAAAIASFHLNKTVRFVMSIESMMGSLGKRMAFHSDYQFTAAPNGRVLTFTSEFVIDAGWSGNEALYNYTFLITGKSCYNNVGWINAGVITKNISASNTFMRAPGSMESISLIENLMEHISYVCHIDPVAVRMANLDPLSKMNQVLPKFSKDIEYEQRLQAVKNYNIQNRWKKRGIGWAVMEFGVAYFGDFPCIVTIYHYDGTVIITHGGIEMGQGLNTKAAQVAAATLNIPLSYIKVYPSNSITGSNAFVSGGSVASESVCYATQQACQELMNRLDPIRAPIPTAAWPVLINAAYAAGIDLQAKGEMTPLNLLPYTVVGASCTEIEVDMLTGETDILRVDIVEDCGQSLNPLVDIGQIEGAFVMGLGYWLTENLVYDQAIGKLLTDRTWNYKIPGAKDIPKDFRVTCLPNSTNATGFMRSKATGEPGICISYSVISALRMALMSARKDAGLPPKWLKLNAPTTRETILLLSGTKTCNLKL